MHVDFKRRTKEINHVMTQIYQDREIRKNKILEEYIIFYLNKYIRIYIYILIFLNSDNGKRIKSCLE